MLASDQTQDKGQKNCISSLLLPDCVLVLRNTFNPCSVIKMEDAILYGLEKLTFTELRPNQRNVIEEYASKKDGGFFALQLAVGNHLLLKLLLLC